MSAYFSLRDSEYRLKRSRFQRAACLSGKTQRLQVQDQSVGECLFEKRRKWDRGRAMKSVRMRGKVKEGKEKKLKGHIKMVDTGHS